MLQKENYFKQPQKPLYYEVKFQDGTTLYTSAAKITKDMEQFRITKGGGILADEVGLGKTLMALALILQTLKKG
jgi:DNA repair protein RAD5